MFPPTRKPDVCDLESAMDMFGDMVYRLAYARLQKKQTQKMFISQCSCSFTKAIVTSQMLSTKKRGCCALPAMRAPILHVNATASRRLPGTRRICLSLTNMCRPQTHPTSKTSLTKLWLTSPMSSAELCTYTITRDFRLKKLGASSGKILSRCALISCELARLSRFPWSHLEGVLTRRSFGVFPSTITKLLGRPVTVSEIRRMTKA